jgi:CheY-like chemotaxis protein
MSRSVLLVDPDVDALGTLASKLRLRGLTVTLADSVEGAIERARNARPDAILIADSLGPDGVASRLDAERDLANLPRFTLVDSRDVNAPADTQLVRGEADAIARRLFTLPPKVQAVVGDQRGDFRGDLNQVSVVDLLQLLSMNRRTGGLSISTASGSGEVRLLDGEVVDAVYRRLDGEKALFRLLGEPEGSFAFAGGSPSLLRRVHVKTNVLLMEGLRQIDELKRRRESIAAEQDALLSIAPPAPNASEASHRIAEVLTVPRTLEELLDDVGLPDLEIVEALDQMLQDGSIRRIAKGAVRAELADSEQMTLLGALIKRLSRGSFTGAARLILSGTPRRLATLSHSVSRIADTVAPAETVPVAPVPHLLATLKLPDAVELDVVGLPEVDAYCPLWGLTLPGSVAVVRVDPPQASALDEACGVAGVPLLDATTLVGSLDEADPTQVATLIRNALDAVAAP